LRAGGASLVFAIDRRNLRDMPNQFIDINTPDGACDSYIAFPDGAGPFPGVLLFMDGVGFRATLQRMADRIAADGYFVLLPNMYYRQGRAQPWDVKEILKPENRPKLMQYIQSLTPDRVVQDAGVFLGFLSARKEVDASAKIGLTGYCMGAAMALRTAAHYPDRIGASAGYHGGRLATDAPDSPHRLVGQIAAELYFGHADKDENMPAEQIAKLEAALKAAGVRYRSEVYAGAAHGFTMPDLPVYNAGADERHWKSLLELFARTLKRA
jgi:carboxymethylenebutenolidase